ncbi:hypothetical protein CAJAP_03174 [Camponotus japonicus]
MPKGVLDRVHLTLTMRYSLTYKSNGIIAPTTHHLSGFVRFSIDGRNGDNKTTSSYPCGFHRQPASYVREYGVYAFLYGIDERKPTRRRAQNVNPFNPPRIEVTSHKNLLYVIERWRNSSTTTVLSSKLLLSGFMVTLRSGR